MNKLGVIVPHRHRWEHLDIFKKRIVNYLNEKKIPFEIIIVNQDDAKQFNRGMLLNIGFKYAKRLGCNYVVFHDIDLIPIDVDYSYSEYPVHLAKDMVDDETEKNKKTFDQYFGGVTIFPVDEFRRINGYSNKYWGWGFEDDDLLLRCVRNGCETDLGFVKNAKRKFTALYFNGINSYVEIKNNFNTDTDLTFFVSFYPEELECDHTKDSDVFTAFSLPGYDTAVSYNSFQRYNFVTFDDNEKAYYINSDIKPNYQTIICVTISLTEKKIKFYQDGELIGETDGFDNIRSYEDINLFYLGAGNPNRIGDPNMFKGLIDSFAVIKKCLSEEEALEISKTQQFKKYRISKELHLLYNAKNIRNYRLVDQSGNKNHGRIFNCDVREIELPSHRKIEIPRRRKGLFKALGHSENGFFENKWKDHATRWNQLRFVNEISKNYSISAADDDGVFRIKFTEHGIKKDKNITWIDVGI
jgi:hypothetical protein